MNRFARGFYLGAMLMSVLYAILIGMWMLVFSLTDLMLSLILILSIGSALTWLVWYISERLDSKTIYYRIVMSKPYVNRFRVMKTAWLTRQAAENEAARLKKLMPDYDFKVKEMPNEECS